MVMLLFCSKWMSQVVFSHSRKLPCILFVHQEVYYNLTYHRCNLCSVYLHVILCQVALRCLVVVVCCCETIQPALLYKHKHTQDSTTLGHTCVNYCAIFDDDNIYVSLFIFVLHMQLVLSVSYLFYNISYLLSKLYVYFCPLCCCNAQISPLWDE